MFILSNSNVEIAKIEYDVDDDQSVIVTEETSSHADKNYGETWAVLDADRNYVFTNGWTSGVSVAVYDVHNWYDVRLLMSFWEYGAQDQSVMIDYDPQNQILYSGSWGAEAVCVTDVSNIWNVTGLDTWKHDDLGNVGMLYFNSFKNVLYVAGYYKKKLLIVNVDDPTNLWIMGAVEMDSAPEVGVAYDPKAEILFVNGNSEIYAFDVSDSTAPTLAGTFDGGEDRGSVIDGRLNTGLAYDVEGQRLFGACPSTGKLYIIDASEPEAMVIITHTDSYQDSQATSVQAFDPSSGYLYITMYKSKEVKILDVSGNTIEPLAGTSTDHGQSDANHELPTSVLLLNA